MIGSVELEPGSWEVERREDGAVVVRVRSAQPGGKPLPDAVFAFRDGDPQYFFWEQKLQDRRSFSA